VPFLIISIIVSKEELTLDVISFVIEIAGDVGLPEVFLIDADVFALKS